MGKLMNTAPTYQVRMYCPMRGMVWASAPSRAKTGSIRKYPPTDMQAVTSNVSAVPWLTRRDASS